MPGTTARSQWRIIWTESNKLGFKFWALHVYHMFWPWASYQGSLYSFHLKMGVPSRTSVGLYWCHKVLYSAVNMILTHKNHCPERLFAFKRYSLLPVAWKTIISYSSRIISILANNLVLSTSPISKICNSGKIFRYHPFLYL